MDKVHTTKGLVNRDDLTVLETIEEDEKARYVKTQWFLGDELVRQDGWVNLKQGITMEIKEATLG